MKRVGACIAAASLMMASCQQIFTTSVASFMARDTLELPSSLTREQALAAAEQALASGDANASLAVIERLSGLVAAQTDPSAAAELKAVAASLAISASGVDQALASVIELMGSGGQPSEEAITTIIAGINAPDTATSALRYLADEGVNSTPDQKVLAAVVLLVSATDGDLSQLENPDPEDQDLTFALALVEAGVNEMTNSGDTGMLGLVLPFVSFLPQP